MLAILRGRYLKYSFKLFGKNRRGQKTRQDHRPYTTTNRYLTRPSIARHGKRTDFDVFLGFTKNTQKATTAMGNVRIKNSQPTLRIPPVSCIRSSDAAADGGRIPQCTRIWPILLLPGCENSAHSAILVLASPRSSPLEHCRSSYLYGSLSRCSHVALAPSDIPD